MRNIFVLIYLSFSLSQSLSNIGWIEIAGYTTRDRQIYGPALRRIYNDTLWGVHLVWKDEPSRVLYNFFDRSTGSFKWTEGKSVFTERVNLGNLDVNPRNHCPYIVGNYFDNNRYVPVYASDSAPGQGNFNEFVQRSGFKWSVLAVTNYGYIRFFCQKEDTLYYRAIYDERRIGYFGAFPTHNITSARDTSRIALIWTATVSPFDGVMFIRDSRNSGTFWFDTIAVSRVIPSMFNHTYLGGYGFYDLNRKLHIVANTYDGNNPYQVELWHCLKDTPLIWSRICSTGTYRSISIGSYALYAGRPSIGQNPRTGDLFACWEQFDSLNYEPLTGLARAEIWASRSTDNGLTWGEPICITVSDNTSKRFPSLAPIVNDTLHINYIVDSVAGFWEQGQGPKTTNPIIYHRVPANFIPVGIAEPEKSSEFKIQNPELEIYPNPFISYLRIKMNQFWKSVKIYDVSGHLIKSFLPKEDGDKIIWDVLDNNKNRVKPGVYFCELTSGSERIVQKIILVR